MSEVAAHESRAVRVTLFEDRAEVERRARATVAAGASWVAVPGVSVLVDDASVVAGIRGERARVIGARVARRMREVPAAGEAEIAAAESDLRAARRREIEADRALGRAAAHEERCDALAVDWIEALGRARVLASDASRSSWRAIVDAQTAGLDQAAAHRAELARARHDLARAELRLTQARTSHPRHEAVLEVQVEARDAHVVEIDLTYRTPCALWRPEYLARLVPTAAGHELVLRTYATVWQHSGEEWRDVACRFSTARPARSAAPPLLVDDLLRARRRTDAERRSIAVDVREQAIALAGLDGGVRAVDEMPGVDDGGEPLTFDSARPVTIPSDGQPFRQEIAETRMPCRVERVAWPERSEAVHLRGTATLPGGRPLLAGPARVARAGELVGRGKLGFVAAGEPFELGFGVDDGLRIRRRVEEKRDTVAITGTQRVTRTVRLYLANLGGEPRSFTVVERFPVSEIGEVEVQVVERGGARLDERDGFATFEVELGPGATRELAMSYRVEAAAKVLLHL